MKIYSQCLGNNQNQVWDLFFFLGVTVFFYKFIFWLVYKSKIGIHFILLTSKENQAWKSFSFLSLTVFFIFWLVYKSKIGISYFCIAWENTSILVFTFHL